MFPFTIDERQVAGRPMRVLTLDLAKADADEFTRTYHPKEYGLIPGVRVHADYDPLTRRSSRG